MSLSSAGTPQTPPGEEKHPAYSLGEAAPRMMHRGRIWTVCFAILAFEIGGFLIVFPWMDAWRLNHFPSFYPPLFNVWDDPYFRGAVTGLGVVNVIIALWQTAVLLKKPTNS